MEKAIRFVLFKPDRNLIDTRNAEAIFKEAMERTRIEPTLMAQPFPNIVGTWRLPRENSILSRFHLIEHAEDSTYPSFLVLLNNSIELEISLFQWFKETCPDYILFECDTPDLVVPTNYLPFPMRRQECIISFHPSTELPEEPYAGNISLPVYLIPPRRNTLFPDHIFTLTDTRLQSALCQKICQRTTVCLRHMRALHIYTEEMPVFHVVGSLGLYKDSVDQEVLLLVGEDAPSDHTFKYVRLQVHPTHVGPDVNLILTHGTDWQQRMHRRLEKWDIQDKTTEYEDKTTVVEVLYAKFVLSLRAQCSV
jgi:hypothetical protein